MQAHSHPRIVFGAQKLAAALKTAGYEVSTLQQNTLPAGLSIVVGTTGQPLINKANQTWHLPLKKIAFHKEGFNITPSPQNNIVIAGLDNSGALYGCLEIADRVKATGALPQNISLTDHPEMVLRGACIGLQKSTYLPGRTVYEYPYTPETFPWFYDKALWLKYLDQMAENRMNSLYLWNGHPFASLVKLKDYPYAVEVDDATFKKNEEMFRFLTTEADKRGIWVIQAFYNIIVSKPFAEKNHLKTQDRNRPIVPIIADYTRKSIAAFVQKYPNVGLLITLGEAMEGVGDDDVNWFTKTIIPGVKDGLKALGQTEEPPIVLRAHDTDAPADMKYALPLYKNLYTMAKYNGEALTTYTPRGPWAELHKTLSHLGSVQIENVHIMANLEPFRYGSANFIQKCVQAMHNTYGANGLHIYPQASYWDWPYSADKVNPRLLQMDRDWIWYKEWARYAWNSQRDSVAEAAYWARQVAEKYGCDAQHGSDIMEAYNQSGEIAPKLLRRYGITDGNRQTLTLGMFVSQMVNPERYGLYPLLYNSEAPEGEMVVEYAEKEAKHQPHIGETPVKVAAEVVAEGKAAITAIEKAAPAIKANKAEFARLKNDMYCYNALANFYAEKVQAALLILKYKYSNKVADLQQAVPHLQKSVEFYKQLTGLTKDTYLYANSMQTSQRKIPVGGNDGKNKTWAELLPQYESELQKFSKNVDSLKRHEGEPPAEIKVKALPAANVSISSKTAGAYELKEQQKVYSDSAMVITDLDPLLRDLKGIRFSKAGQIIDGTTLTFTASQPVKVLVGFFNKKPAQTLAEPQLEVDASANDYGQAEIKLANSVIVSDMGPVNVHAYAFPAGTHTLALGKGACLILGFTTGDTTIPVYDAGLNKAGTNRKLDELFN